MNCIVLRHLVCFDTDQPPFQPVKAASKLMCTRWVKKFRSDDVGRPVDALRLMPSIDLKNVIDHCDVVAEESGPHWFDGPNLDYLIGMEKQLHGTLDLRTIWL